MAIFGRAASVILNGALVRVVKMPVVAIVTFTRIEADSGRQQPLIGHQALFERFASGRFMSPYDEIDYQDTTTRWRHTLFCQIIENLINFVYLTLALTRYGSTKINHAETSGDRRAEVMLISNLSFDSSKPPKICSSSAKCHGYAQ